MVDNVDLVREEEVANDIIEDSIISAILENDFTKAESILNSYHISESVMLFKSLSSNYRDQLLLHFSDEYILKAIDWLPSSIIHDLIKIRGIIFITSLVTKIKSEDVAYRIIKNLTDKEKNTVLAAMLPNSSAAIRKKLSYPKESAGRLMYSNFVSVNKNWTVEEVLHYISMLRKNSSVALANILYDIFVVDDEDKLVGAVSLSKAVSVTPETKITSLLNRNFRTINANLDQEEVALIFRNRGFISAGVVDDSGKLIGVINLDDVVDVIYQEAQEDLLLMSGVLDRPYQRYMKLFHAAQSRLRWLSFNFVEALIIPLIVTLFHGVLSKHVIIAALIQFVVALGGNAGMQSLSVTIRGLSLKAFSITNPWEQISKELGIALINGSLLGIVGFAWGSLWGNSVTIGLIAFAAVCINVILGVSFGTLFPIILKRLHIDPAIASSVCVTTATDIVGFFIVLLIATLAL